MASSNCATPKTVNDVVGNAWEWVGDTIVGGYGGRPLPVSGYVNLVDKDGAVINPTNQPGPGFGGDYAMIDPVGVRGILRGRYYLSGKDAGIFA